MAERLAQRLAERLLIAGLRPCARLRIAGQRNRQQRHEPAWRRHDRPAYPTSRSGRSCPWLIGANRNMPAEPAAVPMPKTSCAAPVAHGGRTRQERCRSSPPQRRGRPARRRPYDSMAGWSPSPSAAGRPHRGCRRAPAPARCRSGRRWRRRRAGRAPQNRFCSAMARPKVVRSQPFSASIGSWKKPIAERGPKVRAAIRQPQTMISQGRPDAAGRASCRTHCHAPGSVSSYRSI